MSQADRISKTEVMIRKPAPRARDQFAKEVQLLASIKPHDGIVAYMGACWKPATQQMQIFEFCSNGNLRDHLRKVP